MLARKKLAHQRRERTFKDDDTGREFSVHDFGPEEAIQFGWWFYTDYRKTPHPWGPPDLADCRQWMWTALTYNDGQFSPLKRNVVAPEQYFDLTIDLPWARYAYTLPNGNKLEGQLAIKGTVDLVTTVTAECIEYIDWKTGQRKDWATRKIKEYSDLRNDPQMRMYHYALTRLYPRVKYIIMTIFFIKDGGPYSLCFDQSDVAVTLDVLRRRFEEISDCVRPRLNSGWKTCGLCDFSKTNQPGTMKTVCEYHRQELLDLGLDRAIQKHGKANAWNDYGDGGGRTGKKD